ncbi:MAG: T9SS type A sorting domain-containing protein [Candidatus Kapabacteria bacterium]|nr:T9SS type A sorting domain-containing protein [Candidatus Kapabacteria bacterium]
MKKLILLTLLIVFSVKVNAAEFKFRSGVFLHHSTGARIWGSSQGMTSVPEEIDSYNFAHGYFGEDACLMSETEWPLNPWVNEWYRWNNIFADDDPNADISPYLEIEKIIMIKSCYPSSSIVGYGEANDTLTPTMKTIYNYKHHWRAFIKVMELNPDNFFVVWTNAPLVLAQTNAEQARLSHEFCTWAKDTLATGLDPVYGEFPKNVYVFDFFHKLTDISYYLHPLYASGLDDSHPNADGTDLVAPLLVEEVLDAAIFYESVYEPPAPETPEQIQPADDSLYVDILPEFIWYTANHATAYDIEVAADIGFANIIAHDEDMADTSYSSGIHFMYDTEYFWRVNSTNGIVKSDWSEVWSFRTVPDIPEIPTLLFPEDNSSNILLETILTWTECDYTDTYTFEISYDNTFSDIYYSDTTLVDTTLNIANFAPLEYSKTYFWRVRGENEIHKGEWSDVFQFETQAAVPAVPVLVYPADGDETVPVEIMFEWISGLHAQEYTIQVSRQDYFSMLVFEYTTTDTFYLRGGFEYEQTYYWRVKSANHPQESEWSTINEFKITATQPDVPIAVYPAPDQKYVSQTPEFRWTKIADADSYSLRVARDDDCDDIVIDKETLPDSTYQTSGSEALKKDTVYYWQVRAHNQGVAGPWSESYRFTTVMFDAEVPLIISPAHMSEDVPIPPTFVWNPANNAETYTVKIADDDEFLENVIEEEAIEETSFTLDTALYPMKYGSTHYWTVKAVNGNSDSEWSEPAKFEFEYMKPEIPDLILPSNGAVDVSRTCTLTISGESFGPDAYNLELATTEDFTDGLFKARIDSGLTYIVPFRLEYYTEYFWHVNAENKAGTSEWSEVWSFTTVKDTYVEDYSGVLTDFSISPNPISGTADITFDISESEIVTLSVHDIAGNELAILADGIRKSSGSHLVRFNTEEYNVSSGVLIFRLRIGNRVFVKKAVLTK